MVKDFFSTICFKCWVLKKCIQSTKFNRKVSMKCILMFYDVAATWRISTQLSTHQQLPQSSTHQHSIPTCTNSQNVSWQHSNLPVHIDTRNAHDWLDQNLHSVLISLSAHYVNFVRDTAIIFFFLTSSDFHYYSCKKCILVYSEPVTNQTF